MIGQESKAQIGSCAPTITLDPSLRGKISTTVSTVAERLRDPEKVLSVATSPTNKNPVFGLHPWDEVSLSHGYPGVVLLFAELHLLDPDGGWDRVAHEHLTRAGAAFRVRGSGIPSLFSGAGAVAFAALSASNGRRRYGNLLNQLDLLIVEQVAEVLKAERERRADGVGAMVTVYDAIVGLSGTGRYLLHALPHSHDRPRMRETLAAVLDYLVDLSKPIEVDGRPVPGWYVSGEDQVMESDKTSYPLGNFNCGMAHGIAGPLALLSLASLHGVAVPGQAQALRRMSEWLLRWRQVDEHGAYWPDRVRLEDEIEGAPTGPYLHREAWCYGTPGVARALWLAGRALRDTALCDTALQAMNAVFRRPEAERDVDGPNFCHGRAGLLRITHRFALETGRPQLVCRVEELTRQLLDKFDTGHPFGFQDVVPSREGPLGLNTAGLLEGAAGAALALMAVADDRANTWDTAFLIG